ncbi:Fanconi anemia group J protein homolog isoform X6 [Hydra vulgaris]|uniref:Fanconi anemia group J protein homolog isoform X6 n=1 Tax=Hydra vulgaris TaxID=6087 RepID=A0ABM4CPV5_HYDVU
MSNHLKKKNIEKEINLKSDIDANHYQYCISGVNVKFPVKAYPTQISLMSKILQSIQKRQCCLLESPTGSGKSLALLCATLAWLYEEKAQKEEEVINVQGIIKEVSNVQANIKEAIIVQANIKDNVQEAAIKVISKEDDGDDFKREAKKIRKSITSVKKGDNNESESSTELLPNNAPDEIPVKLEKRKKISKIYFGTRTHKQITQIIRELKKTAYKDVRMSILSSREYTCIHHTVSKNINKNEECKKLVRGNEGKSCRFYNNVHLLSKNVVQEQCNLNTAWDIEDLVAAGKKKKACPYFGARELSRTADIIFCPFNYLIDPVIRNQMSINIDDGIVILDEAHNIEDASREAASSILTVLELEEAKRDLQFMIDARVSIDAHTCLMMLCDGMLYWIESVKDQLVQQGFEYEAKVWTGKEIIKMFQNAEKLHLSCASVKLYKDQLIELTNKEQQENVNTFGEEELSISSKTLNTLLNLMKVLEKLFDESYDYSNDYRVILSRTAVMVNLNNESVGGWKSKSKYLEKVWTYEIKWCCLNPAVVFSEVGRHSRCVILSSGTLSPMSSFASELGIDFPITYEGNHIISDSQVWVSTLSVGPSGNVINANYTNSETFLFQDDIGNILLHICEAIPRGILCFFPSYHMMEKLHKRWEATGLLDKMSTFKVVFSEPRGNEKKVFDETLKQFYECVTTDNGKINGALLLAVCRGKVSEGLDFSDDNARAVVAVGIPFPNVKDLSVTLKRKYNDLYISKGLLSGNNWYELQAFRALNQALGRCIRHKNDWGALLMIDVRFSKTPKYVDGLSKWIRTKVKHFNDFQTCFLSVCEFAYGHQKDLKKETSMIIDKQNNTSYFCKEKLIANEPNLTVSCFETSKIKENNQDKINTMMTSSTLISITSNTIKNNVCLQAKDSDEKLFVHSDSNKLGNGSVSNSLNESKTKKSFFFRTPTSAFFTSKYSDVKKKKFLVDSSLLTKDINSSISMASCEQSVLDLSSFINHKTRFDDSLSSFDHKEEVSFLNDTSSFINDTNKTFDYDLPDVSIAPLARNRKILATQPKKKFKYPVNNCEKLNETEMHNTDSIEYNDSVNRKNIVHSKSEPKKACFTYPYLEKNPTSNDYLKHNVASPVLFHPQQDFEEPSHSTPNVCIDSVVVNNNNISSFNNLVTMSTQDVYSKKQTKIGLKCKGNILSKFEQSVLEFDATDVCDLGNNVDTTIDVNTTTKYDLESLTEKIIIPQKDNFVNFSSSNSVPCIQNENLDNIQLEKLVKPILKDRNIENEYNKFADKSFNNIVTKNETDIEINKHKVQPILKQNEKLETLSLAIRRKKRNLKRNLRETQKTKDEFNWSPEFHSLVSEKSESKSSNHHLLNDTSDSLFCLICKTILIQGDFESCSESILSKKVILLKKKSSCIQLNLKHNINGFEEVTVLFLSRQSVIFLIWSSPPIIDY